MDFQWPGLGRLLVDAIAVRDIPLVQGGILVLAVLTVLVTLLADPDATALAERLLPIFSSGAPVGDRSPRP